MISFKTFPPFVYAQAIAAAAAPSSSCTAARSRTAWPATATTRWPPLSRPRPSSTPRGTPSPTRCRGTRPWSWSTRRTRGRTSSRYVREHFDALSFPRSLAICYHFFFQIGRSSESPIDFVVMDTVPGNRVQEKPNSQSTISR